MVKRGDLASWLGLGMTHISFWLLFLFFKIVIKQNERGNPTAGFQLWMPFDGSNNLYKMLGLSLSLG